MSGTLFGVACHSEGIADASISTVRHEASGDHAAIFDAVVRRGYVHERVNLLDSPDGLRKVAETARHIGAVYQRLAELCEKVANQNEARAREVQEWEHETTTQTAPQPIQPPPAQQPGLPVTAQQPPDAPQEPPATGPWFSADTGPQALTSSPEPAQAPAREPARDFAPEPASEPAWEAEAPAEAPAQPSTTAPAGEST